MRHQAWGVIRLDASCKRHLLTWSNAAVCHVRGDLKRIPPGMVKAFAPCRLCLDRAEVQEAREAIRRRRF